MKENRHQENANENAAKFVREMMTTGRDFIIMRHAIEIKRSSEECSVSYQLYTISYRERKPLISLNSEKEKY